MIITDLAVFVFEDDQLTLIEVMTGATLDEVRSQTTAAFVERVNR